MEEVMTQKQIWTAIGFGILSAFGKGIGDAITGRIEPRMLLPMAGFGMAGAGIYLLYRFLRDMYVGLKKANADTDKLRTEFSEAINLEKRLRNGAFQEAMSNVTTLANELEVVKQKVHRLTLESTAHKEGVNKVTATLIEAAKSARPLADYKDLIKPPAALDALRSK
jgi:hypothetical protein